MKCKDVDNKKDGLATAFKSTPLLSNNQLVKEPHYFWILLIGSRNRVSSIALKTLFVMCLPILSLRYSPNDVHHHGIPHSRRNNQYPDETPLELDGNHDFLLDGGCCITPHNSMSKTINPIPCEDLHPR